MNWLYYLLESNLYLIILYLVYFALFRKETYYQVNRAYLLLCPLPAFTIPLLQLGILKPDIPHLQTASYTIVQSPIFTQTAPIVTENHWAIDQYVLAAYVFIVGVMLTLFVTRIIQLLKLSRLNKATEHQDFTLIELPGEHDAFSFFKYLFVGKGQARATMVIRHEMIHIQQRHSWDIIYFELLKIVSWFNPAVYLMQNSIKQVHEFIADEQTASDNDVSIYADFLLANAYGIHSNTLTNTFFNKNLLKKRIMMLYQKRSGTAARLKFLILLPLLAGLLCVSTLAFAKTYGWVDLIPGNNSANLPLIDHAGKIKRLKVTQGSVTAITDKIFIRESKEKTGIYTVQNLTENDKHRLLQKYNIEIVIVEATGAADGKPEEMNFPIMVKADKNIPASHIKNAKAVKVIRKQTDSTIKGATKKTINKQLDTEIKGEIKKAAPSQSNQQVMNKLPPPEGYFPGCRTLYTYLEKNIKYPADYLQQKTVDNVIVQFTTGADYKLKDVKITNNTKPGFADEVSRQLKSYTDTVNRASGTYFFVIQFNLINEKMTRTWLPSGEYLQLTGKPDCAGNIEIVGRVKDE